MARELERAGCRVTLIVDAAIGQWIESCMAPGQTLSYVGRPEAASPAVGYHHRHQEQLNTLVDEIGRAHV